MEASPVTTIRRLMALGYHWIRRSANLGLWEGDAHSRMTALPQVKPEPKPVIVATCPG